MLNNNNRELTSIKDMDKLEDESMSVETLYIIAPALYILKEISLLRSSIKGMVELKDAHISTKITSDAHSGLY